MWAEDVGGSYVRHEIASAFGDVLAVDDDLDGRLDLVAEGSTEVEWYRNQIGRRL